MLDFTPVLNREITIAELSAALTIGDLGDLTNEMVDTMLEAIAGCIDADVTFEPLDSEADDPVAVREEEKHMPWTLGHVIVHTTASAEEAAFLAAELARGVIREGRSRYETPWREVTTIAQCCDRLKESRRMRLASLELWPEAPHLETVIELGPQKEPFNPMARFVTGLAHDASHIDQIHKIVGQVKVARL